jgi:hypothetical protein
MSRPPGGAGNRAQCRIVFATRTRQVPIPRCLRHFQLPNRPLEGQKTGKRPPPATLTATQSAQILSLLYLPCKNYAAWGNRACRRPFRPPSNLNRPLTQLSRILSGFVSRRHRAAKPRKFVSKPGGRLKAEGTLWTQPGLAALWSLEGLLLSSPSVGHALACHGERSSPGLFLDKLKHVPPGAVRAGEPVEFSASDSESMAWRAASSLWLLESLSWVGRQLTVGELCSLWQSEARPPTKTRLRPPRWNL